MRLELHAPPMLNGCRLLRDDQHLTDKDEIGVGDPIGPHECTYRRAKTYGDSIHGVAALDYVGASTTRRATA